jgi:hypothetical protein
MKWEAVVGESATTEKWDAAKFLQGNKPSSATIRAKEDSK